MRKRGAALVIVLLLFATSLVTPAGAAEKKVLGSSAASVSAVVGQFYLSVSGYIAPYASVVLSSDGVVLRSSVADASGAFSISQILIKAGFSHFCIDAVDFKRLGESEACFTIPPATGSVSKDNILLPPTLGVYRTNVNVGDKALAFGYSMPGATVTVHINNSSTCVSTADSTGYYQCQIAIEKAGQYTLKADAVWNDKASEPPTKSVLIQGLSLPQQVGQVAQQGLSNLVNQLLNIPGGLLIWIAIGALILIIILLRFLKPEWFPKVSLPHPAQSFHQAWDNLFRERRLHHSWMKGVGF